MKKLTKLLLCCLALVLFVSVSVACDNDPIQYGTPNKHTPVIIEATEATCTEEGLSEGVKCSECGEILVEPKPTGYAEHVYDWDTDTCVCGLKMVFTEGLEFNLKANNEYEVVGIGSAVGDTVIVPRTYQGIPVTSIKRNAFLGNKTIKKLVLRDNIKKVEMNAFTYTFIESIELPAGIEYDYAVFSNSSKLTSIVFEEGTEELGSRMFDQSKALTSVTLPSSLKIIRSYAFADCEKLESVELPSGIELIECRAFSGCTALTSVTIPAGIGKIQSEVFSDNPNIASVVFEQGVTDIPGSIFKNCHGLISVTIPSSVETIGAGAFAGCEALADISIPEGVKVIGAAAFGGCKALKSVILSNTLEKIDVRAFIQCEELESITFGNSVQHIGEEAFAECPKLIITEIPQTVTYIHKNAFSGSALIESKMELVGNAKYFDGWLMSVSSFSGELSVKSGTRGIAVGALRTDNGKTENSYTKIIIPSSMKHIPDECFYVYHSTNLEVVIEEGITYINGFQDVSAKIVHLPSTVEYLSEIGVDNVYYNGTKAQFEAIEKGDGWKTNSATVIHCDDGHYLVSSFS